MKLIELNDTNERGIGGVLGIRNVGEIKFWNGRILRKPQNNPTLATLYEAFHLDSKVRVTQVVSQKYYYLPT